MNRRLEAIVAGFVQALIMLLALAVTATAFDRSELLAVMLALPALVAMEYLRSSGDLSLRPRMLRLSMAMVGVGLLVLAGLALATTWKVSGLRSALTANRQPILITRYEDAAGRAQTIHVPREPRESPQAHRERAAEVVAAIQLQFPMKGH